MGGQVGSGSHAAAKVHQAMRATTEQDYRERIVRSLLYVQDHLDDELRLDDLASVAAFSAFHFHRIVRGMVGESVAEHVRRLRLERAARNLKQGSEPVIRIALDAGFEAHESFTRAFTAMFGASPSAYRAAHKPAPDSPSSTHLGNVSNYRKPNAGEALTVEMKQLGPVKVVFLRHPGPYSEVGSTWGRLLAWAGRKGLLGPGIRMLGIVYDDPDITPAEKVRYDNLGQTYQRFFGGWLPKSGHEPRDVPAFEEYLNSPTNTSPEKLETRIYVPLAA